MQNAWDPSRRCVSTFHENMIYTLIEGGRGNMALSGATCICNLGGFLAAHVNFGSYPLVIVLVNGKLTCHSGTAATRW